MKNLCELYINSRLVDLTDNVSIPLVLQVEDITNPGAIKTNTSKTVSLISTKHNDSILNHLYRSDRVNGLDVYSGVPFELRLNNEIIQKGYVEFGNINIDENDVKTYELNLMSEEASFFYKLANTYFSSQTETNMPFNLAGNPTLEHQINSSFIYDNWFIGSSDIHSYIKYIPIFQGIYKDFNSKKYIIQGSGTISATIGSPNIIGSGTIFTSSMVGLGIIVDGKSYTIKTYTNSTHIMISDNIPDSYNGIYQFYYTPIVNTDEWSIKMFSSYRQKPALSLRKIFESMQDYFSDYSIDLSDDFFSSDYYLNSFLLLNSFSENKVDLTRMSEFASAYNFTNIISNGNINETTLAKSIDNINIYISNNVLFRSDMIGVTNSFNFLVNFNNVLFNTGLSSTGSDRIVTLPISWSFIIKAIGSASFTNNQIGYSSTDGGTYRGIIKAGTTNVVIQKYITGVWEDIMSNESLTTTGIYTPNAHIRTAATEIDINMFGTYVVGGSNFNLSSIRLYGAGGYPLISSFITYDEITTNIQSGSKIDTKILIPENLTVKDLFLEYCKIFNLYITVKNNEVSIKSKKNFFSGDIIDWSNKIDLKKDRTMNAVIFNDFRYILGYKESTSNQFLKQYKDQTKYNYGDAVYQTAVTQSTKETRLLSKTIFNPIISINQNLYNPFTGALMQQLEALCNFDIINGNERDNKNDSMNIVFYAGTKPYNNFYIFDDDYVQIKLGEFCYSMLNTVNCYSDIPDYTTILSDKSLDFSKPSLIWSNKTYPANTIGSLYWNTYISDRFNANTKMLTAYFDLRITDINQFSFGNFIFYDGRLWVVNKIEFDPTTTDSSKVELISVNDSLNYTT